VYRDEVLIQRARQLRRDRSDAEKQLWYHLRGRQMDGHRFRRQVPIGSYIADFACLSARLVIEVDGGQHNEGTNETLDAQRTEWLKTKGYRVLRFGNSDLLTDIDSVTETVFNELQLPPDDLRVPSHPHPDPPPEGGGNHPSSSS
jgi:very-short-patch-repair endonuclease